MRRLALAGIVAAVAATVALGAAALRPGPRFATLASVAVHTNWTTYGYDDERSGFDPSGGGPSVADAPRLRLAWRRSLDGVAVTSPLFVSSVPIRQRGVPIALVGTEHGEMAALDAVDGRIVWTRRLGSVQTTCYDMPGDVFGITGTPVIDTASQTIYVADSDGRTSGVWIHALALASGAERPGWPLRVSTNPTHTNVWGALTLSGGRLYATMASLCDQPPSFGRVVAIDVSSARIAAQWEVVHDHGGIYAGGGIWGYGGASVNPRNGEVFVATGNAFSPEPEDQPYAERVVDLSPALRLLASDHPRLHGEDVDFGSTPVLMRRAGCPLELAVENKTGQLFAYRADRLDAGPVQVIRVAANASTHGLGVFIGLPAFDPSTGVLYVSDPGPDERPYRHGMIAFRLRANCRLSRAWNAVAGTAGVGPVSSPTVSNGVVYFADGAGSRVFASDAHSGTELWNSGSEVPGPAYGPVIAAARRVFVASWSGLDRTVVEAFAPGPP